MLIHGKREALKKRCKAEHMAISISSIRSIDGPGQQYSWQIPAFNEMQSIRNSINLCKQYEQSYDNMSSHSFSTDFVFSANIQYCKQTEHFLILVYLSLCTRYNVYLKGLRTPPLVWCCFKKTIHNAHLVLALFLARV
jgi:hypothetical protein